MRACVCVCVCVCVCDVVCVCARVLMYVKVEYIVLSYSICQAEVTPTKRLRVVSCSPSIQKLSLQYIFRYSIRVSDCSNREF